MFGALTFLRSLQVKRLNMVPVIKGPFCAPKGVIAPCFSMHHDSLRPGQRLFAPQLLLPCFPQQRELPAPG